MSKSTWHGFEVEEFKFRDRDAKIAYPSTEPIGKLLLKTEYWDAFPNFEIEMLKRGYYLCYVKHNNKWATDDETALMAEFVKFVTKKLGIKNKCIPVGMSCGGLQALRLAQLYPKIISCLYIDAPVTNLISEAGLGVRKVPESFWPDMAASHGLTRSTMVTFRDSPIDHMDILLKYNIPIIMVYGDTDIVVIYEENGKVLEDYYKANGGIIEVIRKPLHGHHPHGLYDPTPIVEFVEKYS